VQRRRIQKAVETLRLGMTDAIAVSYYNEVWITPGKIWKDVQSNYETVVGYDANHYRKSCTKVTSRRVVLYLSTLIRSLSYRISWLLAEIHLCMHR